MPTPALGDVEVERHDSGACAYWARSYGRSFCFLAFILHVPDYAGIVESLCLLLTPKKNGAISIQEMSKDKKIIRGKGEKEKESF